jgi:hypothetical protein
MNQREAHRGEAASSAAQQVASLVEKQQGTKSAAAVAKVRATCQACGPVARIPAAKTEHNVHVNCCCWTSDVTGGTASGRVHYAAVRTCE